VSPRRRQQEIRNVILRDMFSPSGDNSKTRYSRTVTSGHLRGPYRDAIGVHRARPSVFPFVLFYIDLEQERRHAWTVGMLGENDLVGRRCRVQLIEEPNLKMITLLVSQRGSPRDDPPELSLSGAFLLKALGTHLIAHQYLG
jgi:hypothetical protein